MALNEKKEKILSIDVTDTSYLTSSTLSLPVNWADTADDIEYNNAVVLATAMARGIDYSRIVKEPEKEELPPPPTFDKNNPAPDMKKIMIDETIEVEKSTNQQEQERSLLVE